MVKPDLKFRVLFQIFRFSVPLFQPFTFLVTFDDLPSSFYFLGIDSISNSLDKVIMSSNFTGDNAKLRPAIAVQNGEHS